MPDIQSTTPAVRINLTRVGVKNVKKLVEVSRPEKRYEIVERSPGLVHPRECVKA